MKNHHRAGAAAPCPECGAELAPLAAENKRSGLRCPECGLVCLHIQDLTREGRAKLGEFEPLRGSERRCPNCKKPMQTIGLRGLEIERCSGCEMIAFDPGEALDGLSGAKLRALFALSLPERAIRSIVGTAGATARELTHVLVPPVVRGTRFWNAAVERSLGILAEGVGNVRGRGAKVQSTDTARLAVGSMVDTAALVVFHVSPLWLLAAVHDVAKGSRRYLDEVVDELKDRGALPKSEHIDGVDHLLDVLAGASGELQSDVDRPPLSIEELRSTVDRVRESLRQAPKGETAQQAEQLARELEAASKREGRSLREVSNAVAVGALSGVRLAGSAAAAGAGVARRMFIEEGWRPYFEQLAELKRRGFAHYLSDAAQPIADAVKHNFDPDTDTLTAQLVSGRLWKQAVKALRSAKK